jgi:hypothetical protein
LARHFEKSITRCDARMHPGSCCRGEACLIGFGFSGFNTARASSARAGHATRLSIGSTAACRRAAHASGAALPSFIPAFMLWRDRFTSMIDRIVHAT